MDCTEAKRSILKRGAADERLQEHLAGCGACAALAEDHGALARWLQEVEPTGLAPEASALLAEVQQDLAREERPLARLRSLATPVRVALAVAGALVVVGIGVLKLRPDLGVYPPVRLAVELLLLGGAAAAAGWLFLRPLHRPPVPSWLVLGVLALGLGVPWALAALPQAHLAHPASLAGTGDDLIRRARACLLYGTLLGAPLVLLVTLAGRGGRGRLRWALLPAVVGGVAGLISLLAHCPLTASVHLLAGHAPVVLVLVGVAAVGAWVARRGPR